MSVLFLRAATVAQGATAGLVAAYAFDEGAGTTVTDASGTGNNGAIGSASWTASGKYANALSFNGTSSKVTVADSASLDLTTGMTLEAWVFPTDGGGWRDVVYKGVDDTYYLMHSSSTGVPALGGKFSPSSLLGPSALPLNTWSHLAGTYDGTTLRLYVNGTQVASRAQSGPIQTTTGELTIGGDGFYGQYFQGRIDEVRVYNVPLTQAQIQSDMNTAIGGSGGGPPDSTPPTVSITSPAAGSSVSQVQTISATASDNFGVSSVGFFVDGTSVGTTFTAPYVVQWNTTTVTNGPHTLTAVASDTSGLQTTSAPVAVTVANSGVVNPGFVNEVVVPDIVDATTIAFLPDGRMLVGELSEKILVVQPGASQPDPTPFLQLESNNCCEQGLMDILLDQNFAQNGYYYIFYTKGTPGAPGHNRVSRFTASGNGTIPGSEQVLWEDPVGAAGEHHGGSLAWGADGKLYFTYGDQFQGTPAQDLTSFRGKVLRINKDGTVPTDNPFYDGTGPNKDAIWALGLRNPFRMSIDPVTDKMYIGDVGGNDASTAWEEVNLGARGANYGWPLCEGPCGISGVTSPIHGYAHNGRDGAIVGGVVYRGTQFPSEYQGSYFFGDYVQNTIKRLVFDSSGNVASVANFWPADGTPDGPSVGDPVKFLVGPDGSLYYVDIGFTDQHVPNPAAIRRIRYIVGDQPPSAVASGNPTSGQAPLTVQFSSAGSSDPEGAALTYSWVFGDGGTSTQPNPAHTYQSSGQYTARLTVSDGVNSTVSNGITIFVGSPPVPTISSPTNGALFRAGDTIAFSGDATDPDETLPASAFDWTILFHHESHVHPGGSVADSKTGTLQIPTSGHDFQGATSYEIVLTVTDSTGLTASTSVSVFPDKVNVSFDSVPSGLTLQIDGISKVTPFTSDDVKGFQHTINAPNQTSSGNSYTFSTWSDGGAQSHGIVVPDANQSYTATFQVTAGPTPVAAYAFDEGAGTTVTDASGTGNNGAIGSASWTASGKYANALSFNGTSSKVTVADSASLDLTTGMTLEAWVFPTDGGGWRDVVYKGVDDTYYLMHSSSTGVPALGGKFSPSSLLGPSALPLNTWSHLAGTYDGTTLRLYVNGTQVASRAQSGPIQTTTGELTIGGDGFYGQYFQGRIDEVRVYTVPLTQAQIQSDMNTAIGGGGPPLDTTPPTAPTNLTATAAGSSQINLSWTGSTDNVAVTGYRLERCQGAGCTNFLQVATPPGTTFSDIGLVVNTSYSYRVRAVDAAINFSGYSNVASATTAPDTTPPTAPTNLTATAGGSSQINLSWTAATDNVAVTGYRLERCQGSGCSGFAEIAQPTGTTFSDAGRSASTSYSYRVRAVDAAGNLGPYSGTATATTPASTSGFVAAYAFNEGSGTTAADASGNGLTGTLTNGATWGTGRNAGAVLLDGVNDFVELGNPLLLRLTGSMTVSAWVNSATFPRDDAAIVSKRTSSKIGYQLDTTVDRGPRTIGFKLTNSSGGDMFRYGATTLQANTWYHVTGVYNAATSQLHVYLNGQLDDGTLLGTVTSAQQNSSANVQIGRRPGSNNFNLNGRIDDVRIYSRALTLAEIQADMNAPVAAVPATIFGLVIQR